MVLQYFFNKYWWFGVSDILLNRCACHDGVNVAQIWLKEPKEWRTAPSGKGESNKHDAKAWAFGALVASEMSASQGS